MFVHQAFKHPQLYYISVCKISSHSDASLYVQKPQLSSGVLFTYIVFLASETAFENNLNVVYSMWM